MRLVTLHLRAEGADRFARFTVFFLGRPSYWEIWESRSPERTDRLGTYVGHGVGTGDEAYALISEALTASGDICPSNGQLLIRLDPLTAPRRTQALAALCDQLTAARARYPGTNLVLRYEVKSRPSPA